MDSLLNNKVRLLEKYGYRIATYKNFVKTCRVHGLVERAKKFTSKWVIFDPSDNDQGYLLQGDNFRNLINEAHEFLELEDV